MKTLIVSDLHLGNGGPYDVFAGGEALPAMLDHLSGPLRVIVNGDSADFLMNDDPLELDEARAVSQAQAIARNPASAAVLRAFGRVLARGGEVTIRLGNHDVELSLPAVQAVFRDALGQPADVAARLVFALGNNPGLLDVGGARILITHGEQDDPWNQVDYGKLLGVERAYAYAPGSSLVKNILNPGVSQHGMRFLSLLKPDFQGATLSALAVDPTVAKALFKGSSVRMLASLFRRRGMAVTFDAQTQADDTALFEEEGKKLVDAAGLDEGERRAIERLLGENAPFDFAGGGDDRVDRATLKIAKVALSVYGSIQRKLTRKEGDAYFALDPTEQEWAEARRLGEKFGAGAVIMGHSHAARWKEDTGLVYANTGTWIGLMQLPRSDASDDEWTEYLTELRDNRELDPAKQNRAKVFTRFSAALVEEEPGGGASLSLVEWDGAKAKTVGATRVPAAG